MDSNLTRLISAASRGEIGAGERLWSSVIDDVHVMAERAVRRAPSSGSLRPTELVSEVYFKVLGCKEVPSEDRRYFFGMVARAIGQILADRARRRRRLKRGGDVLTVSLDDRDVASSEHAVDPALLSEALDALAKEDPLAAEVVRLKVWPGLTTGQVADVTAMSVRSVEREWQFGRLWLARWIREQRTT